jgi:C4-type Zn-finger protein
MLTLVRKQQPLSCIVSSTLVNGVSSTISAPHSKRLSLANARCSCTYRSYCGVIDAYVMTDRDFGTNGM